MAGSGRGGTVGLAIEVIFIATLGVAAVSLVINANYSGWDTTSKLLFQTVLVIIIAIAFIILVLKRVGYKVDL